MGLSLSLGLAGPTGCSQPAPSVATVRICAAPAGNALPSRLAHDAAVWQSTVERGPLFAAATASSPLAGCQLAWDAQGNITLSYLLRDGGSLQASRNLSIEYSEQSVRFGAAISASQDPAALLARAERSALGAGGCGIDWRESQTTQADGADSITESVYRGDVCNCQARVRRDAEGRVRGLLFRSSC